MFINMKPDPYPGEPWGFDNGAFRYWKMGIEFPMESYRKKLTRAYSIGIPVLSAIPDKLGDHKTSYEMALYFLQSNNLTQWPWYFCLQDGASFQDVGNLTASISGLFLGGSNKWKEEHAKEWCDYAHEHNLKFHYGRCSTPRKLRHAKEIGADSVDSAFILWTTDRFIQFAREWGK